MEAVADERGSGHSLGHPSEITDANPWLRMTGWPDYLKGTPEKERRDCVAAPEEDTMDVNE